MNISKYCDFILEEKISQKTGKQYYCISARFGDYSFPLIFLTKDRYDLMIHSFNK